MTILKFQINAVIGTCNIFGVPNVSDMNNSKYDLIVITGPTASGKTGFAANLANNIDAEIISADSRQIYRGMNLGTGKDYDDYTVNNRKIPYHLIDIVDAGTKYNVYEYQNDFLNVYNDIKNRDKQVILCGGTGMYVEAIVNGYKLLPVPENTELRKKLENHSIEELAQILAEMKPLHNKSDFDTKKRAIRAIEIETYYKNNPVPEKEFPDLKSIIMGVKFDRESRRRRITERLIKRLEDGMLDEVKNLLKKGIKAEDLIYYGLEYKYLTLHTIGEISYQEMFDKLNIAIHQFAKRQMTWFRKMERNGMKIHWFDGYMPMDEKVSKAMALLD